MKKNSENTRQKLLAAAMREFAAYGVAGGRVDRIAREAGCNKQLIYAYFSTKEGLFNAVFEQIVDEIMHAVPFDACDLPGYAARLANLFNERKEIARLLMWRKLERLAADSQAIKQVSASKIAAVEAAQADGKVSRRFPATALLTLISQLTLAVSSGEAKEATADIEQIVEAVRLLCSD